MDALRAGHDFLPAHEEVVAVCEGGVGGGRVRVEGAEGARVGVYGVEVCVVFGVDEGAESAFLDRAGEKGGGLA